VEKWFHVVELGAFREVVQAKTINKSKVVNERAQIRNPSVF